MVVPLAISQLASSDVPRSLCPTFQVQGLQLMPLPVEAAPIPKRLLNDRVQMLKRASSEIIAAMDAVMTGI